MDAMKKLIAAMFIFSCLAFCQADTGQPKSPQPIGGQGGGGTPPGGANIGPLGGGSVGNPPESRFWEVRAADIIIMLLLAGNMLFVIRGARRVMQRVK